VHSQLELTVLHERVADMARHAEKDRLVRAARPRRARPNPFAYRPALRRRRSLDARVG
jgi:hypothetical protein